MVREQVLSPIRIILQKADQIINEYIDSKDYAGRTPLSLAAEEGYEAIVKLLLATGQVEVNSKDHAVFIRTRVKRPGRSMRRLCLNRPALNSGGGKAYDDLH